MASINPIYSSKTQSFDFRTLGSRAMRALARPWENTVVAVVFLSLVCAILFFHGLTIGDLWRTESLRAIIGQQFLQSGNWIVPRLYGEPLFTKPPGMYAAIALCSWPFGQVTEFSARLPSALAATFTVFLFYWYFCRQLGKFAGFIAALILPISPLWMEKASAAEIDMLQVAFTSAAILFFFCALEAEEERQKLPRLSSHSAWGFWMLSMVFMAGGLLTKWTTPAFYYLTALPLLWWRGQLSLLWKPRHICALALAGLLFVAWACTAIALEGWSVFYRTIESEAAQRLVPSYSPKPYPWDEVLLHPLVLFLTTLPFSVVALLALRRGFFQVWDEKGQRLLQGLTCWAVFNVLFWSLPTEHTPRHSFPLFPAVSGIAAMVLFAALTGKMSWPWRYCQPWPLITRLLVFWICVKLVYVHCAVPVRTLERRTRETGQMLARFLPTDCILYIFMLKNEGIMFYYGGEVQRLHSLEQLPQQSGPTYCVVVPSELRQLDRLGTVHVIERFNDEQGDPMMLVQVMH